MKSILRRLPSWLGIAGMLASSSATHAAPPPRDRILILVSLDGFRWDYLQKFKPPHLTKLAAEGVHAEKLIPVFPSMTFPNHHTIMTGLWPEHHGIIHNNFHDASTKETFAFNKPELQGPQWWGGEPVWATAIKQGLRAHCLFWPGTGTTMAGLLPTEWKRYEGKPEPDECVDLGLGWLEYPVEKRPSLVCLYLHHTDTVGHRYGPDSPQLAASVAQVDRAIGRLVDGLHRLKLDDVANLVIVSDHGMAEISTNRLILLGDFVSLEKVQVDFSGAVTGLRPLDGHVNALFQAFKGREKHFQVYRRETTPKEYHFRDNARIPPVLLVADEGWYVSPRSTADPPTRAYTKATHGYDPNLASMGATFIAWGPAFRRKVRHAPVENVHIYNLLCATLGVKAASNDGDDRLVRAVLAE